jgi:hypothetical protein
MCEVCALKKNVFVSSCEIHQLHSFASFVPSMMVTISGLELNALVNVSVFQYEQSS